MPRIDPEFPDALTRDELDGLLRAARSLDGLFGQRDAAWIDLVLATGIKTGDLVSLTIKDARAARKGDFVTLQSGRIILFSPRATRAIRALQDVARELGKVVDGDPLIAARHGKRMTPRNLDLRLASIVDQAELLTPRITIKALVDTHRAGAIAARFSWFGEVFGDER